MRAPIQLDDERVINEQDEYQFTKANCALLKEMDRRIRLIILFYILVGTFITLIFIFLICILYFK